MGGVSPENRPESNILLHCCWAVYLNHSLFNIGTIIVWLL